MWLFLLASLVRKTSHELNNHLPHPYRNVLYSNTATSTSTRINSISQTSNFQSSIPTNSSINSPTLPTQRTPTKNPLLPSTPKKAPSPKAPSLPFLSLSLSLRHLSPRTSAHAADKTFSSALSLSLLYTQTHARNPLPASRPTHTLRFKCTGKATLFMEGENTAAAATQRAAARGARRLSLSLSLSLDDRRVEGEGRREAFATARCCAPACVFGRGARARERETPKSVRPRQAIDVAGARSVSPRVFVCLRCVQACAATYNTARETREKETCVYGEE